MPNQRISLGCDFASSGSDAATAIDAGGEAKRRIDVLGSNDSKTVTHNQPTNSTKRRRQQRRQALRMLSRMASIERQHGEAAEGGIGRELHCRS